MQPEQIHHWIEVAIGSILLVGLAGSVSVLFYRVRRLEDEGESLKRLIIEEAKRTAEVRELLVKIETTVEIIREQLTRKLN